jgi:hypothetical protein
MGRFVFKLGLAIVLLAVIVGISYIKTSLSAKRESQHLKEMESKYAQTIDSLHLQELKDSSLFYIDSLVRMDAFYRDQIDSLNQHFSERESTLIADIKAQAEKKKTTTKKKSSKPKTDPFKKKVRTEYKKRINALPNDLTSYEMRVAYNEVHADLSKKFKISPDSLKKLIK